MQSIDTQIANFKLKRAAIEKLQSEVELEKRALDAWVSSTDMCKNWQVKAEKLNKELETYKAEMKAQFGIADGERTDVLELIATMKKVAQA